VVLVVPQDPQGGFPLPGGRRLILDDEHHLRKAGILNVFDDFVDPPWLDKRINEESDT
jgi:hypothetical protein